MGRPRQALEAQKAVYQMAKSETRSENCANAAPAIKNGESTLCLRQLGALAV
jgi:hypothetical protein